MIMVNFIAIAISVYGGVQLKGCICEPCPDISLIWRDMRSRFGYMLLGERAVLNRMKILGVNDER